MTLNFKELMTTMDVNKDVKIIVKKIPPGIYLLKVFTSCFSVSVVNFEHVIAGWDDCASIILYVEEKVLP